MTTRGGSDSKTHHLLGRLAMLAYVKRPNSPRFLPRRPHQLLQQGLHRRHLCRELRVGVTQPVNLRLNLPD